MATITATAAATTHAYTHFYLFYFSFLFFSFPAFGSSFGWIWFLFLLMQHTTLNTNRWFREWKTAVCFFFIFFFQTVNMLGVFFSFSRVFIFYLLFEPLPDQKYSFININASMWENGNRKCWNGKCEANGMNELQLVVHWFDQTQHTKCKKWNHLEEWIESRFFVIYPKQKNAEKRQTGFNLCPLKPFFVFILSYLDPNLSKRKNRKK